jgi:hypothetical protein
MAFRSTTPQQSYHCLLLRTLSFLLSFPAFFQCFLLKEGVELYHYTPDVGFFISALREDAELPAKAMLTESGRR